MFAGVRHQFGSSRAILMEGPAFLRRGLLLLAVAAQTFSIGRGWGASSAAPLPVDQAGRPERGGSRFGRGMVEASRSLGGPAMFAASLGWLARHR